MVKYPLKGSVIMTKQKRKNKKKSIAKKILISFSLVLLVIVIISGGYLIGTFSKMKNTEIDKDNLGIVEEELGGYENADKITNIALFGIDSLNGEAGRSDSIMVATIDPIQYKHMSPS